MVLMVKVIWLQVVLPKVINRQKLVVAKLQHHQVHLLTIPHLPLQAPATNILLMVKQLVDHLVMFPTMVATTPQMVSTIQVTIMLQQEAMEVRLQLPIPHLGKVVVEVET